MTSQEGPPLDEMTWRDPVFAQTHGIHENSILPYFQSSPFFDPTSNNAIITSQAQYNPNMAHLLATRSSYEGRIKTMSGLEFLIAQEPAEMAPGTGTGVWVIRKQTRRKRPPEEDEITVLATYYVVAETIYMAPTVGDIIGCHMLTIFSSMNKILSATNSTPKTLPWLDNNLQSSFSSQTRSQSRRGESFEQTSKETTPLPDSLNTSTSSKNRPSLLSQSSSRISTRLLEETLKISLKYGDEFMDENPITGFPGEFHLSSSGRKDKDKDKLAVPTAGKPAMLNKIPPPQPSPLKMDVPPVKKESKSPKTPAGGIKPKRKKSKIAGLASPVSPT